MFFLRGLNQSRVSDSTSERWTITFQKCIDLRKAFQLLRKKKRSTSSAFFMVSLWLTQRLQISSMLYKALNGNGGKWKERRITYNLELIVWCWLELDLMMNLALSLSNSGFNKESKCNFYEWKVQLIRNRMSHHLIKFIQWKLFSIQR